MNWAMLPPASKAIFPVIGCHCDEHGIAFPSERTIAILAGRSDKKVREGILGLKDFPGFRVWDYITPRGRRAKKYSIELPSMIKKNRAFPFYKYAIEGGNWRELKPTAQAIYPVMRCFGFFDMNMSIDFGDIEAEVSDFDEIYPSRSYDYCSADPDVLAEYGGISKRSIWSALNDLESNFLIESHGKDDQGNSLWKVYLRDHGYWKRDFLNRKVMESYQHER